MQKLGHTLHTLQYIRGSSFPVCTNPIDFYNEALCLTMQRLYNGAEAMGTTGEAFWWSMSSIWAEVCSEFALMLLRKIGHIDRQSDPLQAERLS